MERELKAAKQLNKVAVVVIIVMMIMLSFMAVNMHHLKDQYEKLELCYEELYEEWNEIN